VAAGDWMYPAVGRLIFASYPAGAGPVRILLIHRGPVLSLGTGVIRRAGCPITTSRVGHRTQSASPRVSSQGSVVIRWFWALCVL